MASAKSSPLRNVDKIAKVLAVKTKSKRFYFQKFLKSLGFRRKKSCGIGYPWIFIHRELQVVVKRPFISDRGRSAKPRKAIKTKVIKFYPNDADISGELYIFVQPLADVSRSARRAAMKYFDEFNYTNEFDYHSNNVAVFRGKPVLIDW